MIDETVKEYHFERQRQCLEMAAAASDPCARHLHEQLAVEHHKLAAAQDQSNEPIRRSDSASAADQLEDGDDHRDHEQDVDQPAGYVERKAEDPKQ